MSEPSSKRARTENGEEDKDALIAKLQERVAKLEGTVRDYACDLTTYYASTHCQRNLDSFGSIAERGMSARHVKEIIHSAHLGDFVPELNTSSYVNVVSEPEEKEVALLGAEVNIADASVYPASIKIHDKVVNMIAKMWHAPEPTVPGDDYVGAGTVGSTEACLLAGLAHKFRWRKWYADKHDMTDAEVQAVKPNIVISTAYQAAWEKFFRYMDVDAKLVKPSLLKDKMAINAKNLVSQVDEKTIAVVAILGNHYNGVYDPVWDINDELEKLNEEKGYQVGIHVDAASGGFIAPFQEMGGDGPPPFDFRLKNVLTMSTSGHKFGESICGTGWVIFRQRENLSEHIAVSVTYLGGHCDSITLNFSRPASGPYVQFYKLLRLGIEGYKNKVENQMKVAAFLRKFISELKHPNGKPRFQLLDGGDSKCLPVVAARLNPELELAYNDIDLQHALSESHWYVSGYSLGFENFMECGKMEPLFNDMESDKTMFRIVCKSNLVMGLANNLSSQFAEVLAVLDSMEDGYRSMRAARETAKAEAVAVAREEKVSMQDAMATSLAESKWLGKTRKSLRASITDRRGALKEAQKASTLNIAHVC